MQPDSDAGRARPDVLDPDDAQVASLLEDWLTLQRVAAWSPLRVAEWLRAGLDPRTAWRGAARVLSPLPNDWNPKQQRQRLSRSRAKALPVTSAAYPRRLAALSDPAALLLVRGCVRVLEADAVAVVGSRAATVYGRRVARQLGEDLARAGLVVVSGLARGIDAEAHLGALEAGGTTVAVLACGIDSTYPREHTALADRIAENGAVIGEMPLGTAPRPALFPLRNRLISGLASAVVVVEARERSGSLTTAAHAANQGRDVFAVPGPITAPTSAGTNRLLRDGAGVVVSSAELLAELGVVLPATAHAAAGRNRRRPARESLRAILDALADSPASRDELGRRLGRAPEQLAPDLFELELDGWLEEDRDGRLRVVE